MQQPDFTDKLIILNGLPTAEKSNIINAFQSKSNQSWQVISMNERDLEAAKKIHQTIAASVRNGNHVIVDYVMHDAASLNDLGAALNGIPAFAVGIKTSTVSPDTIIHQEWTYNMETRKQLNLMQNNSDNSQALGIVIK